MRKSNKSCKRPKSHKGSKGQIQAVGVLLILGFVLVAVVANFLVKRPVISDQAKLKRFSSEQELKNFLKENTEAYSYYGTLGGFAEPALVGGMERTVTSEAPTQAGVTKGADEYSTTNIQVAGVDEADIVKNDDKYIYVVSGNKVVIVDAYPAENAEILSELQFNSTVYDIFINDDKLVVFGYDYGYLIERPGIAEPDIEIGIVPRSYSSPKTFVKVYDVSDREAPVLERDVLINGTYFDSRMIGDYVYVIINQHVYYSDPQPVPLPVIESSSGITTKSIAIPASEIYYFDYPDRSYILTTIMAVDIQRPNEELGSKTFLLGYSQNMYASIDNIYIVYTKHLSMRHFYDRIVEKVLLPVVPSHVKNEINSIRNSDASDYEKMQQISEIFQNHVESLDPEEAANLIKNMQQRMEDVYVEISKEMEKTIVHKISVQGKNIEYKTAGEVPGNVLNQFSMDEYNGYFRIATTTGNWRATSANHLYILDESLNIVGKVEDLAKGERIYSTRFIGDKGYMVTFRQVDPLFVIDLSNPTSPQVLGYLKIPGVSDYLHPYDETHIIGIGRDATEEGRMLGMKLSLFDVSDVSNPTEVSKYIIGEAGTYSEVLNDHKAFLFDRSKSLLVIPVTVREKDYRQSWQGAYVFNLDLDSGFVLKGKVTHANETNATDDEWYMYDYATQIRRSLYMDDVLYTISNRMIKMNDLDDLNEINAIQLPYESGIYYPLGIK